MKTVLAVLLFAFPVFGQSCPSGQSCTDIPSKPVARLGQFIAPGAAMPDFTDDLVMTPSHEDGRPMWKVRRVNSCVWCAKPMTLRKAMFDKQALTWWIPRIGLMVTDIEITHHMACFQANTCREGNPLLGQSRVQGYAVAGSLTAMAWLATGMLRKGDKAHHVGGFRWWQYGPIVGDAFSLVGIVHNLAVNY